MIIARFLAWVFLICIKLILINQNSFSLYKNSVSIKHKENLLQNGCWATKDVFLSLHILIKDKLLLLITHLKIKRAPRKIY